MRALQRLKSFVCIRNQLDNGTVYIHRVPTGVYNMRFERCWAIHHVGNRMALMYGLTSCFPHPLDSRRLLTEMGRIKYAAARPRNIIIWRTFYLFFFFSTIVDKYVIMLLHKAARMGDFK